MKEVPGIHTHLNRSHEHPVGLVLSCDSYVHLAVILFDQGEKVITIACQRDRGGRLPHNLPIGIDGGAERIT